MKPATTKVDLTKLAHTTSRRAIAANTPQAHRLAADAHDTAARHALAEGNQARADKHRKVARKHRQVAEELPSSSESRTHSPGDLPETDTPDRDGKDENPLLTWANARS